MNTNKKIENCSKTNTKNGSDLWNNSPEKTSGTNIPLIEYADLMGTEETSKFLHISVDTLYKWVEQKIVPHYRITGKKILFNRKKLCQWLAECEVA